MSDECPNCELLYYLIRHEFKRAAKVSELYSFFMEEIEELREKEKRMRKEIVALKYAVEVLSE